MPEVKKRNKSKMQKVKRHKVKTMEVKIGKSQKLNVKKEVNSNVNGQIAVSRMLKSKLKKRQSQNYLSPLFPCLSLSLSLHYSLS